MHEQTREWGLAQQILRACPSPPVAGIVLGSGLSDLVERIDVHGRWPFAALPGFAESTAVGHPGNLVVGKLDGVAVVALQGRLHLYEGYDWAQVVFPVRVMRALGAELLILSNAAGGINPAYHVGDVMLLRDHISLLLPPIGRHCEGRQQVVQPGSAWPKIYEPAAIDRALRHARRCNLPVHVGTYAALPGPNYETRAEYRLLRAWGVDAVGMSTVPEAIVGARLGMRVVGISVITNACSPDVLPATSGAAVVQAARQVEHRVMDLVRTLVHDG